MIAAADPQEFVPSGRQHILRHPGLIDKSKNSEQRTFPDFLSNEFEKVIIDESKSSEKWLVRSLSDAGSSFLLPATDRSQTNEKINYNSTDVNISWLFKSINSEKAQKKTVKKLSEGKSTIDDGNIPAKKCAARSDVINYRCNQKCIEEELYIKNNTVIWSGGLVATGSNHDFSNRVIKKSFTLLNPVKHALWCKFYCEHPSFDDSTVTSGKLDVPIGEPINCVCVVDSENVYSYTENCEDFVTSLPFAVKKVFECKFGMLVEKDSKEHEDIEENYLLPTIFSLSHPLDEFYPVAVKQSPLVKILDDCSKTVLFTSKDPSLCVIYDERLKQHSVYLLRRLQANENLEMSVKSFNKTGLSLGLSDRLRSRLSLLGDKDHKKSFSQGTSFSSKIGSNINSKSHSSMAAISRCQSPAMSPLVTEGPLLNKLFRQSITRNAEMYSSFPMESRNTEVTEAAYQLAPNFCLELLWTDSNLSLVQNNSGPASKVFLSSDLAGRQFLCYLVPTVSQLILIEITASKDSYNFNFLTSIAAKDADVIPHLHMIAILDHNSNITLYSGTTLVGKLHIGGVLVQHSPTPYSSRNYPQFNSPFPRRSTLLPHNSTPVADPYFEEHLLSPVLPLTPSEKRVGLILTPDVCTSLARPSGKIQLVKLRDAIDNRLTLQYSDGTCYRITFPDIVSSSLINTCLNAIKSTLGRDLALSLISKWYTVRNAPGCLNHTQEKEWKLFTTLIFELLGYNEEEVIENSTFPYNTPSSAPKKQRTSIKGSEQDWNHLLEFDWHKKVDNNLSRTLNLKKNLTPPENPKQFVKTHVDVKASLFPHVFTIFYTFHLVYEELKLNSLRYNELPLLANFLNKLSADLGLYQYEVHYWKDFPNNCELRGVDYGKVIPENELKFLENKSFVDGKAESVFQYIFDLLNDKNPPPFPYIPNINVKTKHILQLSGLLIKGSRNSYGTIDLGDFVRQIVLQRDTFQEHFDQNIIKLDGDVAKKVVSLMTEMGITNIEMDTFPSGINLLFHDALWQCRESPPTDWNAKAYNLLQRSDLAAQAQIIERSKSESIIDKYGACGSLQEILPTVKQGDDIENEDGMEDIDNALLKLRFPTDHRVAETRKLLQSSKPVTIALVQRPDVSDHDFIDEQEKHLYAICSRTMALPVGRGMFTMRTATPIITEPLPCPRLCLTGKTPPRGATVELTHIDTPPNMNLWPLFHNGVANGLRISPDAHNIDSNWIVFNKPKNSIETTMEHAGFLMALGLNGHLKNLAIMKTFDYLSKFHEMTSVGVLLGMSAATRGSASTHITKMLSIHVEALLPPTSMELDIPQNLQVAALMGIGLVYQGTGHRHMTEVLLSEIGRPPGPEMDNSIDRESYALSAGLALGLVTLRQAGKTTELTDLNVPDTLHYYMVGGNKRPLTGSQKDKYKVTSFQIKEGSTVNLDVTAPAATLALSLMFMGSGNKAVADWMAPPTTQYLLDFVRPDFLMLRALARALILWDDIVPSKAWVESRVPSGIRKYCLVRPSAEENGIDYEAMNQAYCNIVAGVCFAMGLKYAGCANNDAYKTLLYFCHMFTSLISKSIAELAGKSTIETCLNIVLISASIVMSGTGDLGIMRIVRHLRRRVGVGSSSVVTYGSHLAVHMALGLLFLGGGRYTLSNSPASVAALICAFYPKFPTHSNDNRYHLQAFRHLYVLAVEPRIVIPKDISTGKMCYAWLKLVQMDGKWDKIKGPCLIPDINTLSKVCIEDERYWPVVFERGRNWDLLLKLIGSTGFIEVKQRAGCLSYTEDKLGFQSQLARTLTQSTIIPWDPPPKSIISFSSDSTVRHFTKHFLISKSTDKSEEEAKFQQTLTRATYDYVIRDKLPALPILINLVKTVCDLDRTPNVIQMWQFRIICSQILNNVNVSKLISDDSVLAVTQKLLLKFNNWEPELGDNLRLYVMGKGVCSNKDIARKISLYVTYYDIPYNEHLQCQNWFELLGRLNNMDLTTQTIDRLLKILEM